MILPIACIAFSMLLRGGSECACREQRFPLIFSMFCASTARVALAAFCSGHRASCEDSSGFCSPLTVSGAAGAAAVSQIEHRKRRACYVCLGHPQTRTFQLSSFALLGIIEFLAFFRGSWPSLGLQEPWQSQRSNICKGFAKRTLQHFPSSFPLPC